MPAEVIARQGDEVYAVLLNPEAPAAQQLAVSVSARRSFGPPPRPERAVSLLTRHGYWEPVDHATPALLARLETAAGIRFASLPLSPAAFEYNPDQPRDERGRFLGGMSTSLDTHAERAFAQRDVGDAPTRGDTARLAKQVATRLTRETRGSYPPLQLFNEWHAGARTAPYRALREAARQQFDLHGEPAKEQPSAGLQRMVAQVYQNTQADLAAHDLKEVTLYRGMLLPTEHLPAGILPGHSDSHVDVLHDARPLASWTSNPEAPTHYAQTHHGVGKEAVVMTATFPASQVFSTAHTGPGLVSKEEFIVLGGQQRVRMHTADAKGHWHFAATPDALRPLVPAPDDASEDWLHTQAWEFMVPAPDGTWHVVATPADLTQLLTLLDTTPEAFAASPAAEAMPAALRAAADFYDPDQPRDEHGRWGSGGGAQPTTNVERAQRTPAEQLQRIDARLRRYEYHVRAETQKMRDGLADGDTAKANKAGDNVDRARAMRDRIREERQAFLDTHPEAMTQTPREVPTERTGTQLRAEAERVAEAARVATENARQAMVAADERVSDLRFRGADARQAGDGDGVLRLAAEQRAAQAAADPLHNAYAAAKAESDAATVRAARLGLQPTLYNMDPKGQARLLAVAAALGPTLHIADAADRRVRQTLQDLSRFPVPLAERLVANGFKGLYIGAKPLPDLDDNQRLRGESPRGWSAGSTYQQVGGVYSPAARQVTVAVSDVSRSGSAATVLHELGHAVGDRLTDRSTNYRPIDDHPRLIAAHERLYDKLNPYERQSGAGSPAGRQEMFAESVAVRLTRTPQEFDRTYDTGYRRWLAGVLK